MAHVFKGHVIHDKKHFHKGHECPKELHDHMSKLGLIEQLPEAIKPEPAKSESKKEGK